MNQLVTKHNYHHATFTAGGDEREGQRERHVRVARAGLLQHALRRLLPEQHVVLLQVPAVPGTLPEGLRQVLVVVKEGKKEEKSPQMFFDNVVRGKLWMISS